MNLNFSNMNMEELRNLVNEMQREICRRTEKNPITSVKEWCEKRSNCTYKFIIGGSGVESGNGGCSSKDNVNGDVKTRVHCTLIVSHPDLENGTISVTFFIDPTNNYHESGIISVADKKTLKMEVSRMMMTRLEGKMEMGSGFVGVNGSNGSVSEVGGNAVGEEVTVKGMREIGGSGNSEDLKITADKGQNKRARG